MSQGSMSTASQRSASTPLEDILTAIGSVFPPGVSESVKDNALRSVRAALENLDFVTRQEIEVQETALRRARQQINELERRIDQLENEKSAS